MKKQKIKCPHCQAVNSQVQIDETAKCKGVWTKCKICKKEFEIKVP